MLEFLNPQFLLIGAALISAPIIIHLINRMRFKRVRWAAMEFLLKSQKRNRRRLIIEQIILLLLRCLLVALAALLVCRFVGCDLSQEEGKDHLHIVILDDTLSMNDQGREKGQLHVAFQKAKEVIREGIVGSASQSKTRTHLVLIPLSKLITEPNYQPKMYHYLAEKKTQDEIAQDLDNLKCSKLHVDLIHGIKKARELMTNHAEYQPFVQVVSDYRKRDWSGQGAEPLFQAVIDVAKARAKVRLIDVAHPDREPTNRAAPPAHDNLSIIELRPETRVAARGMRVQFTVTVANHTVQEQNVKIGIDYANPDLNLDRAKPQSFVIKVPPNGTASGSFEDRFEPNLAPNERYYAQLAVFLLDANEDPLSDGLLDDNVRNAAVEIRNQVPILIIDGEGSKGQSPGGDTFHIENAILTQAGFRVDYGDIKSLELPDLEKYASIYLLNLPRLANAKQRDNLDAFIKGGGGVAFFLGPKVSPSYYNKELYKEGAGLFPVPLDDDFYPRAGQPDLQPKIERGREQLITYRERFTHPHEYPIFGQVFWESNERELLTDLTIHRYFPVPRQRFERNRAPGQVLELATLPNMKGLGPDDHKAAQDIRKNIQDLTGKKAYEKYRDKLLQYSNKINENLAADKKPYELAGLLDRMLRDRVESKDPKVVNLADFWEAPDQEVRELKNKVKALYEKAHYGDPFAVSSTYGKGRVVAVMTTAGKEWSLWCGGTEKAPFTYAPFVVELQNYLTSQGKDVNLTVGTPVAVDIDALRWKEKAKNKNVFINRYYRQPAEWNKPGAGAPVKAGQQRMRREGRFLGEPAKERLAFRFEKNFQPGLYLSYLVSEDAPVADPKAVGKEPDILDRNNAFLSWAQTFNVDAETEGRLQRASREELDRNFREVKDSVKLEGPRGWESDLVYRRSDTSESPWFFLFFLGILVAEQALAVHLSFHLRGTEAELPAQVTQPRAAA
jgi:hypothetical protein